MVAAPLFRYGWGRDPDAETVRTWTPGRMRFSSTRVQYTDNLPFSAVVDTRSLVVCNFEESLHAVSFSRREQLPWR